MSVRMYAFAAMIAATGCAFAPAGFSQPATSPPVTTSPAAASSLQVALEADAANPANPKMGDRLLYRSTIRNSGTAPAKAVLAWLGLVQVDPGQEQPVDLEDWSAHKAITVKLLAPGEVTTTEWPMRLIAAGHYRVVVTAAAGEGALVPSPFVDLAVRQKPVVESNRVLPVALGVPALLIGGLVVRRRRRGDTT